jgi:hypothetical protein
MYKTDGEFLTSGSFGVSKKSYLRILSWRLEERPPNSLDIVIYCQLIAVVLVLSYETNIIFLPSCILNFPRLKVFKYAYVFTEGKYFLACLANLLKKQQFEGKLSVAN